MIPQSLLSNTSQYDALPEWGVFTNMEVRVLENTGKEMICKKHEALIPESLNPILYMVPNMLMKTYPVSRTKIMQCHDRLLAAERLLKKRRLQSWLVWLNLDHSFQ